MAIYIPAIGREILTVLKRNPEINIFGDEGVYSYDFFLISAYYNMNKNDIQDGLRDDIFILGDSGGFQQLTLGKNFSRDKVLDWQERNCTAGMIKDYPCLPDDNLSLMNEKQDKTVEDALWMLDNRKEIMLYSIYFGNEVKDFERMHDLYSGAEFDGLSLGSLPAIAPKPGLILSRIMYMINVVGTKKPIHILGVSNFDLLAAIHYMAHKMKVEITYDSSSYANGSKFRKYRIPFDIKRHVILSNRDRDTCKLTELPCMCPICSNIDIDIALSDGSFAGVLFDLHNLYIILSYVKTLNSLVKEEELYKSFVKKISPRAYSFIELVDVMIEEGIDTAIRKHEFDGAGEVGDWI